MKGKTNFFEKRNPDYSKAGSRRFETDDNF